MFVALNKEEQRVAISQAINLEKQEYYCPVCKGLMVLKNGKVRLPHFAHKSKTDCDDFSNDMSEWHYNWQLQFPEKYREVVIEMELTRDQYIDAQNNDSFDGISNKSLGITDLNIVKGTEWGKETIRLKHRADICFKDYVIEFQHSPISASEFNERNWFYTTAGYKLIWVFDMVDEVENEKLQATRLITLNPRRNIQWHWSYPKATFKDFIPEDHTDNVLVFFQIDNDISKTPLKHRDNVYLVKLFWRNTIKGNPISYPYTATYPGNFPEIGDEIRKGNLFK